MNGDIGNGDVISQEIYARNAAVEDYLDVNINFIDISQIKTKFAPVFQNERIFLLTK